MASHALIKVAMSTLLFPPTVINYEVLREMLKVHTDW